MRRALSRAWAWLGRIRFHVGYWDEEHVWNGGRSIDRGFGIRVYREERYDA